MSGVTFVVDDQAMQAAFGRLADAVTDMRPVMDEIGMGLASRVRTTFEHEASPWGDKWPGLKATLRGRRMKGTGAQILRDTGRLANSISHTVTGNSVDVSTDVEYAAIHNFGGTIQRKGRAGSVRLRTTAGGHLMRQKGSPNLAVFAKRSHKRATERSYQGRDYAITIPARPFFPIRGGQVDLPQAWLDEGIGLITARLRKAVE